MGRGIQMLRILTEAAAKVKDYIDTHPLEQKTTQQLAEYAGISRHLLQQTFHREYRIHIKEYYALRKMQSAKKLLQQGMAARQVAKQCHYHSHSAFITAFKNKFGITPHAWLKQNS
jgi:AraC-like DNA-binding protein